MVLPTNYSFQKILDIAKQWKRTNVGYSEKGAYAKCMTNMQSCSEGQGFLLLIALHTNDRVLFDQGVRYYDAYRNKRGQMQWKQTFDGVSNTNCVGASDGDLDILYCLLIASKKWNHPAYKQKALRGLDSFYTHCINKSLNSIIPIDVTPKSKSMRSADLMFDHLKCFIEEDPAHNWQAVYDTLLHIFCTYENKTTSFLSEFILHVNGKWVPQTDMKTHTEGKGKYAYDSCRMFWRISTDPNVCKKASVQLKRANEFIKKAASFKAENIMSGYSLDGIPYGKNRSKAFIGPFMVLANNCDDQKWVDTLYTYMMKQSYSNSYFGDAVGLCCLLALK